MGGRNIMGQDTMGRNMLGRNIYNVMSNRGLTADVSNVMGQQMKPSMMGRDMTMNEMSRNMMGQDRNSEMMGRNMLGHQEMTPNTMYKNDGPRHDGYVQHPNVIQYDQQPWKVFRPGECSLQQWSHGSAHDAEDGN